MPEILTGASIIRILEALDRETTARDEIRKARKRIVMTRIGIRGRRPILEMMPPTILLGLVDKATLLEMTMTPRRMTKPMKMAMKKIQGTPLRDQTRRSSSDLSLRSVCCRHGLTRWLSRWINCNEIS